MADTGTVADAVKKGAKSGIGHVVAEAAEEVGKIGLWEFGVRTVVRQFPTLGRLLGRGPNKKSAPDRPFVRSAHQATDLFGRLFAELHDSWTIGKLIKLETKLIETKDDKGNVEYSTTVLNFISDVDVPQLNNIPKLTPGETFVLNWYLNRKSEYCPAQLEDITSNAVRNDTRPTEMHEEFNALAAHLLHFKNAAVAGMQEMSTAGLNLAALYSSPAEQLDSVELAMDRVFIAIGWEQWPDQYPEAKARAAASKVLDSWQKHCASMPSRSGRVSRFILWLGGYKKPATPTTTP